MHKLKTALLALAGLLSLGLAPAQTTTVNIPNTPVSTTVDRIGMTLGPIGYYNQSQLLKDLELSDGAYVPAVYGQTVFNCDTSQTQTASTYYSQQGNSSVYWPANAWQGATYEQYAINQNNSAVTQLATGTISASTNNSAADIQLTLGTPATGTATACTTGGYLIVRQTANMPGVSLAQSQDRYANGMTASADVPTVTISGNQYSPQQSLALPNGVAFQMYFDTGATSTLNLNGSYTMQFWGKCATAGCSIAYDGGRGSSSVNGTQSLTTSWAEYSYPFNGTETAATASSKGVGKASVTCTGSCVVWGVTVVEGSTLPGNTTPFRDSVVRALQNLQLGSLRFMANPDWQTRVPDEIVPDQVARQSTGNTSYGVNTTDSISLSYIDDLQLAYFLKVEPWIVVGNLNSPNDIAALPAFLSEGCQLSGCPGTSSQSWNGMFAAAGLHIYFELGNEQWGGGPASTQLLGGDGNEYGAYLKQVIPVLKGASGWNSAVDKVVASGWFGNFHGDNGWSSSMMAAAGCVTLTSTPTVCPDEIDVATYTLDTLANLTDVYHDEVAEVTNFGSVNDGTTGVINVPTIPSISAYTLSKWGIPTSVYEANLSPTTVTTGVTASQVSANVDSLGQAMNTVELALNARRDAKMTGPYNEFGFEGYTNQVGGNNGTAGAFDFTAWGSQQYNACGPGQLTSCTDVQNVDGIVIEAVNAAIGSNTVPLATTQSGTPLTNYASGQAGTIAANSAVPGVNCFGYSNSGFTSYTVACFNHLASSQMVSFSGVGAPTSSTSLMKTVLGGSTNAVTDSNDASNLTTAARAPVIAQPTAVAITGNSDTLQPESLTLYNYSIAATPPVSTTGSMTISGSMSVSGTTSIQ
jgi:hypothetical protein